MNQKGFISIILVILVVVGILGYTAFVKKPTVPSAVSGQPETRSTVSSSETQDLTEQVQKSQPTKPMVVVLSPNGNEVWETGKSQKITWQIKGVSDPENWLYSVLLTEGPGEEKGSLILNRPLIENSNSLMWMVPPDFLPGNYKIRVQTENKKEKFGRIIYSDVSDHQFKIIISATTPKVAVIYPNGGEKWQVGSTQIIKWTSNNLPDTALVDICLTRQDADAWKDPFSSQCIIHGTQNSGSKAWTIPESVTPSKNYKINIQMGDAKTPFQHDESDAPFEIASWNSYTYSSIESGILPNITFKYPPLFGNNPTFISSRNTNRPGNISDDWGGLVEFSPTEVSGDRGLRIEFFKRVNSENSFESYVSKSATSGGWDSPRYFQDGSYRAARIRFSSSSHYDADVGWYFVELPNKSILAISTSGDKKYLYDDDQSGNSTRDRVVSTLTVVQ